jgi:glutathione S-transferase
MAIKLHRCPFMFLKFKAHPCHNVQSALDEQGIEYEVVKGPVRDRGAVKGLSGQEKYPVIEFEDGTAYRAESKEMAERIRAGKLFEGR